MRIYSLLILIPFNLLISFNAFGQEQSMPDWIIGVWHNPYESNMYNFEFWSFSDGNISLQKGIPNKNQEKENLKDKFPGYEIKEESNDSIYKIHFTKELENIIYENLNYLKKDKNENRKYFLCIFRKGNCTL